VCRPFNLPNLPLTEYSYDAIVTGSLSLNTTADNSTTFAADQFVLEAWSHGKAIGAIGGRGVKFMDSIGLTIDPASGIFNDNAAAVTGDLLDVLSGPVRFPQRFPVDDANICQ
jgi:C-terminal domain found in long catalases